MWTNQDITGEIIQFGTEHGKSVYEKTEGKAKFLCLSFHQIVYQCALRGSCWILLWRIWGQSMWNIRRRATELFGKMFDGYSWVLFERSRRIRCSFPPFTRKSDWRGWGPRHCGWGQNKFSQEHYWKQVVWVDKNLSFDHRKRSKNIRTNEKACFCEFIASWAPPVHWGRRTFDRDDTANPGKNKSSPVSSWPSQYFLLSHCRLSKHHPHYWKAFWYNSRCPNSSHDFNPDQKQTPQS